MQRCSRACNTGCLWGGDLGNWRTGRETFHYLYFCIFRPLNQCVTLSLCYLLEENTKNFQGLEAYDLTLHDSGVLPSGEPNSLGLGKAHLL